MNIVYQMLWRLRTLFQRRVRIVDQDILVPRGHLLDWHMYRHQRFDMPIADIARFLIERDRNVKIIDIGANVGDTCAFMMQDGGVSVLCIEGNAKFIPYLTKNLSALRGTGVIVPTYVGSGDIVRGTVITKRGTAAIVVGDENIKTRSLLDILDEHPEFANSQMLKTDTDGFDMKILLAARDFIASVMPIIHVEFSPVGTEKTIEEHASFIEMLRALGYSYFHIFDNFGNHLIRLQSDAIVELNSLISYLAATTSDRRPAIFYYDLVAMADKDSGISEKLLVLYGDAAPGELKDDKA